MRVVTFPKTTTCFPRDMTRHIPLPRLFAIFAFQASTSAFLPFVGMEDAVRDSKMEKPAEADMLCLGSGSVDVARRDGEDVARVARLALDGTTPRFFN
jgi:hypothetical protein